MVAENGRVARTLLLRTLFPITSPDCFLPSLRSSLKRSLIISTNITGRDYNFPRPIESFLQRLVDSSYSAFGTTSIHGWKKNSSNVWSCRIFKENRALIHPLDGETDPSFSECGCTTRVTETP